MGASQSTFDYPCCSYVAKFIQTNTKYLDELNSIIKDYAVLPSISDKPGTDKLGDGKICLQLKTGVAENLAKEECIKKLDDYFQNYLSVELLLSDLAVSSTYCIDTIIGKHSLRCVRDNSSVGKVRITGIQNDVKKMMPLLREHPVQKSFLPKTPKVVRPVQSAQPMHSTTSTFLTRSTSSRLYAVNSSVGLATTDIDRNTARASINKQPANIHPRSRNSSSSSDSSNTQTDDLSTSTLENVIKRNKNNVITRDYVFKMPVQDSSIARFIKYSKTHISDMQVALKQNVEMLKYIEVMVVKSEKKQKLEYHFHPYYRRLVQINQEDFEDDCKTGITSFLRKFCSNRLRFNAHQLRNVALKHSNYFECEQETDKDKVFVRWYLKDNLVLIVGLKIDVDSKKQEIVNFVNAAAPKPRQQPYRFSTNIKNTQIGTFVRNSPKHRKLFQEHVCSIVGSIHINITNPQPNLVLVHFIGKAGTEEEKTALDEKCKLSLNFLKNYCFSRLHFCSNALNNASKCGFDPLTCGNENVAIKLSDTDMQGNKECTIAGCKEDVELQKNYIVHAMEAYMPSGPILILIYQPKKIYTPKFEILLNNENMFKILERRHKNIFKFSGCSKPFTVSPQHPETFQNRKQFSTRVIKLMEKFLDTVAIEKVFVDANILAYLKQNDCQVFASTKDASTSVVLDWHTDGIVIKGILADVEKYKKAIIDQVNVITKEISFAEDVCKVLMGCGVLDKVNMELSGKVEVTCSVEEEMVYFKGPTCFVQAAIEELHKQRRLIEEVPSLPAAKLQILHNLLVKSKDLNLALIHKRLLESHIKGVLLLRSGKIILACPTMDMFEAGCKILDSMIEEMNVKLENIVSPEIFNKDEWKTLVKDKLSEQLLIEIQSDRVRIMGINSDEMKLMVNEVTKYLSNSSSFLRSIACNHSIGKLMIRHYSNNNAFVPSSVRLDFHAEGVKVSGPRGDVTDAIEFLQNSKWNKKNVSFSAPSLLSYFSTDPWKDFATVVESETRCALAFEEVNDVKQQQKVKEESFPDFSFRNSSTRRAGFTQKTVYDNVTVVVSQGDITTDDSDVIINGTIDGFNLSKGAVSSALLRKAGNSMQSECLASPISSTPILRTTHGYNLLCKKVIHLITPRNLKDLTRRIHVALDHAEILGASSVAIPTLGAGGIGFDSVDVASCMSEAFALFASDQPLKLKKIKVVVYEPSLLEEFKKIIIFNKEVMTYGSRKLKVVESKAKSSVASQNVNVVVYCHSDDVKDIHKVASKIASHMSQHIATRTIGDPVFSKLTDHDWIDIHQACIDNDASATFDESKSHFVVTGLFGNANKLYDFIQELKCELREAETWSKMFIWKWAGSSNQFSSLPSRVSCKIEEKYKKNASSYVAIYGSYLTVNFTKMTYDFEGSNGKLKRIDNTAEEIPAEWNDMMGNPLIKVELERSSKEYKKVLKRFQESQPNAHILKIDRIQNPSLYKQYLNKKRDVEKYLTSNNPVERELFHGTSLSSVETICAHGFNRSYAGKNATVYGKGTYFAVKSTYSINYAERSSQNIRYLFLAHVLTGDYCKGHDSYIVAPSKSHSSGISWPYDSVTDNETNPSIFVVFKDSSVYPYYLISFV